MAYATRHMAIHVKGAAGYVRTNTIEGRLDPKQRSDWTMWFYELLIDSSRKGIVDASYYITRILYMERMYYAGNSLDDKCATIYD